jgi:hypothetical protein
MKPGIFAARRRQDGGFLRVVGVVVVSLFLLISLWVLSFFRLGSDTNALRNSVLASLNVPAQKKIGLHVGSLTTELVRVGASFFNLPPEAKSALSAARQGEVCIYRLEQSPACANRSDVMAKADKAMARRGWERVVGVAEKDSLVAVYLPRTGVSASRVKACVMVLQEQELVFVGAHVNAKPLLALAATKMGDKPFLNF